MEVSTKYELAVRLSVEQGVVSLNNPDGLSFSVGDGVEDQLVYFHGSATHVGDALESITYRGLLNWYGNDTLTLTVNDQMYLGAGQAKSDTKQGLSFKTGRGVSDRSLYFTGTLADVNAAVGVINYVPDENFNSGQHAELVTVAIWQTESTEAKAVEGGPDGVGLLLTGRAEDLRTELAQAEFIYTGSPGFDGTDVIQISVGDGSLPWTERSVFEISLFRADALDTDVQSPRIISVEPNQISSEGQTGPERGL
eukprot:g14103.t1